MILAYILTFRIITNGKFQQGHHKKPNVIYPDCSNLVDFDLVKNNLDTDIYKDTLCENEIKLIRCRFGRFKVMGEAYQKPLFYIHQHDFYSEYCDFFEILLNRAIVSTGTNEIGNEDNKITISHWTVTNCYSNNYLAHYIYSLAGNINVNNLTTYSNDENQKSGRVFYVNYQKECNIKNCKFENQHHEQTSGILINCTNKGTINLRNCIFTNCQSNQNTASMLRLNDVFHDLVIENCTFESSKFYDGDENSMRFFINVDTISANHSLTFRDCLFSKLEINSSCGGGIGLRYFQSDFLKVNLFFDNTNFEHIYNDNFGGGVIKIHSSTECNNDNCDIFIHDCFFENISSVGIGGAVYFYSSENYISITDTTFKKTKCEQQGQSIYIDNNGNDEGVSILNCNFVDCGIEKNGFVIFVNSKTTIVENCQIEFTNSLGCGGIFIQSNETITIKDTQLIQESSEDPALKIVSFGKSNPIKVSNCIFDKCNGKNYSFFEIFIMTELFSIENILISNSKRYQCNNYGGIINCNNEISILELTNITFANNTYASLYGGGVGIMIENVSKLLFNKCYFINNEARQDLSIYRPSEPNKKKYYNGDGGGIQLGYFCDTSYMDITFDNCIFENNRAERHGGAIAIQTLGKVDIINCQFLNNTANYNFHSSSSSVLLVENYFDRKTDGRGGAIYINPSYTYEDDTLQCSPPNKFMTDVTIKDSDFELNTGFDGYGIFIEGDDLGTNFNIENNIFIDNYNLSNSDIDSTIISGGVIATEIHSIKINQDPLKKNHFSSSNNIKVNEIVYIDHYGNTPSMNFTYSEYFSNSNYFSNSRFFSNSDLFSESPVFTETDYFSRSNIFSPSKHFSESEYFSQTQFFSKSNYFTKSNAFSESYEFDQSARFTKSNRFTQSKIFTKTELFSETKIFSDSNKFSNSFPFSQSATSDEFPDNSFSTIISHFETSNFTQSILFSQSDLFTNSSPFTKNTYLVGDFTFSLTIIMTFVQRKSVSMSLSYSLSNSFLLSYISELGTYSFVYSKANDFYFPYIIKYYSPSYQPTYILIPVHKKKHLTKEQIIGITCGAAAIFFSIFTIIILFLKKKYIVKDYLLDYSESSGNVIIKNKGEEKESKEVTHVNINNNKDDSDIDLDFWI